MRRVRASRAVALALARAASAAARRFEPMIASSGDLEDYRAFRVAAAEGTRLARAKTYLERHPKGAFADEVSGRLRGGGAALLRARAGDRARASRRYLADLPDGPHADAALALLIALGSSMQDAELRDIARRVRYDDAKLEAAAVQRRAVGEAILGAIGVLLDEDVYGVPRAEAPPELRALLIGPAARSTWGTRPARAARRTTSSSCRPAPSASRGSSRSR